MRCMLVGLKLFGNIACGEVTSGETHGQGSDEDDEEDGNPEIAVEAEKLGRWWGGKEIVILEKLAESRSVNEGDNTRD